MNDDKKFEAAINGLLAFPIKPKRVYCDGLWVDLVDREQKRWLVDLFSPAGLLMLFPGLKLPIKKKVAS